MKWKNAVDFPNNPYSPEALQRRLSQSSNPALFDMDDIKNKINAQRSESPQQTEPLTVKLSEPKLDPIRFVNFRKMPNFTNGQLNVEYFLIVVEMQVRSRLLHK